MLNIKFWLVMLIKFNLLRNCPIQFLFLVPITVLLYTVIIMYFYIDKIHYHCKSSTISTQLVLINMDFDIFS